MPSEKSRVGEALDRLSTEPAGANEAPCVVRFSRGGTGADNAYHLGPGHENYELSLQLLTEGACPACFQKEGIIERLVIETPPWATEPWGACRRSGGWWQLVPKDHGDIVRLGGPPENLPV